MTKTGTLAVLLALLLVGVGAIFADEQSDASEKQDQETLEGPPPDDIELDSTSGTVTGSLQGKEGMRIQTLCTHCNSANIQVGGLAEEFAPIQVDGYPLIDGVATSMVFSVLPADTVAGAKILKGPGRASEPGTAAGGQLLLVASTPKELPMIDASVEAGDYDRRRGAVRAAGKMASWVSGSLVVGDETADAVDDDNDGRNDVGSVDRTFAEGGLDFTIGRNHTIDIGANWMDEENIDGPGAFNFSQSFIDGEFVFDTEDSILDRKEYRAGWIWRFDGGHKFEMRASDSNRDLILRSEVGGITEFADVKFDRFDVHEDNTWATVRYAHAINLASRLEVGVDARDQRVEAVTIDRTLVELSLMFPDIPAFQPIPEPGIDSVRNWSAFVGYDWAPSPRWGLHVGARHDDAEWEAEIFDTLFSTWSTETRADSRTSPRATLRFTPVSAWNFKLVAGGTFRPPRPILAEICCGQEYQRTVDTDAESGESVGLEAVYQPSPSLRAGVYLARTEFDEHILRVVGSTTTAIPTYVLGNIPETLAETAELGVRWSPHRLVTLDGSIGWLSHYNTGDEAVFLPVSDFGGPCTDEDAAAGLCQQVAVSVDRVLYAPDRTGSLSASVSIPEVISLTSQASYTGSMPIQHYTEAGLSLDTLSSSSFWLVNFSFEMPVGKQLEIVGGVDNLTDYLQDDLGDPTTDYNWGPLAGRSWRMGVRYRYR